MAAARNRSSARSSPLCVCASHWATPSSPRITPVTTVGAIARLAPTTGISSRSDHRRLARTTARARSRGRAPAATSRTRTALSPASKTVNAMFAIATQVAISPRVAGATARAPTT